MLPIRIEWKRLACATGTKAQVQIDGTAFAALLAGIDFTAARRGWYRQHKPTAVGVDSDREM